MPSDVITLNALANELNVALKGARIDKIYQPEEDEITFSVYTQSGNKLLVFSASPNLPRLHFTKAKKENPLNAPSFCMLLRKHLVSARIESVELYAMDRNIRFVIHGKNEMSDDTVFHLYMEIMGRYSNLILTDKTDKILDVLRRVPLDQSHTRKLLPSLRYTSAEQNKVSILDKQNVINVLAETGPNPDEILRKCSGLSKETLLELLTLTENSNNFPQDFINEAYLMINEPEPCITVDKNGFPLDFYPRPFRSISSPFLTSKTLSDAIDSCVSEKDRLSRIKSKSKRFLNLVKNAITRTEKKLGANLDKLQDCEKAEDLKIKGEILTANLYRVPKGINSVTLPNFYDENNANISIALDSTKSPSHNAQNYFRRYTKLKRTKDTVIQMVSENRETLNYLKSLLYDITSCERESDLKDIEENLIACGLIQRCMNTKQKSQKVGKPTKYIFENVEIFVGRNNIQNDALTFSASKSDTWLHVKNYHGSHVVVRSGKDLSSDILLFAAELAAYYSEARNSDKIDVDYTKIKNVRRSPSKKTGLVIYTDFSTICVKPNEHKNYITE